MAITAAVPFVEQGSAPPLNPVSNETPQEEPSVLGELAKGVGRGVNDAGADVAAVGSTAAAAANQPAIADSLRRFGADRVAAGNAPDLAPSVPTMADIHPLQEGGLRRGAQYLAGKGGEFLPQAAGAIGAAALAPEEGGLLAAGAIGTAALAPLTTGESLRRQQADPVASQRTPLSQLGHGLAVGLPAAAIQSVPLIGEAGNGLVRAGAGALERMAVKGGVGAAEQGAAGGGAEALQQQGVAPGSAPDLPAIGEAAAGQAIVGGALHGLGGLKGEAKAPGDLPVKPGAPPPAAGEEGGPMGPPKPFAAPAGSGASADPTAAKAAAGQPVGTPEELQAAATATLGTPAATAATGKLQQNMLDRATGWAKSLIERPDLAPADAAAVQQAAADPGDPANAQALAKTTVAYGAKDAVMGVVNKLKGMLPAADKAPEAGTSQSSDYSGVNQLIAQHMADAVPPEVLNDPAALSQLGAATRSYIEAAKGGGDLTEPSKLMYQILGDKTTSVLGNIYKALNPGADLAQNDKVFTALKDGRDEQGVRSQLQSVVESSLPKDHGLDPKVVTERLIDWARGDDNPPKGVEGELYHQGRHDEIQKIFGPNTDRVMAALEGESTRNSLGNSLDMNPEAGVNEETPKVQYFGDGSKNQRQSAGIPMDSPTAWHTKFPESKSPSPAEQLMAKLKGKYPEATVSFEKDLDGDNPSKGRVKVEHGKAADPADITPNEFDTARLKGGMDESPYRLDVHTEDGLVKYDAMKLVQQAKLHMPSDGTPTKVRTARAFLKALGQLESEHGPVEIPPNLKIAKDLSYGDLKEVLKGKEGGDGTERAATSEREQQEPESDVRRKFSEADERLRAHELAILHESDPEKRSDMLAKHSDMVARQEAAYARMNHEAEATDLGGDEGTQAPSKDAQIHETTNRMSAADAVNRSNMDGSAHDAPSTEPLKSGQLEGMKRAVDVALKLKADARPQAKAIGQKIMELIGTKEEPNAQTLSAKDMKALTDAVQPANTHFLDAAAKSNPEGGAGKALEQLKAGGANTAPKLSDLASIVNKLHDAYKERLKLANETAEPKTTLARKDEVMDKSMADRVGPAREAAEQLKAEKKAAPSGDGGKPTPRLGDYMTPLDRKAVDAGLTPEQKADPLVSRYIEQHDAATRSELDRNANEWTPAQKAAYAAGDMERFQKLSGYSDKNNADYAEYKKTQQAMIDKYGAEEVEGLSYGIDKNNGTHDVDDARETAKVKAKEGTKGPKSEAAKKAALHEAASSSDPELLRQIGEATDPKSLQRTVDELQSSHKLRAPAKESAGNPAALKAAGLWNDMVQTYQLMTGSFKAGIAPETIAKQLKLFANAIFQKAAASGDPKVIAEAQHLLGQIVGTYEQNISNVRAPEANKAIDKTLSATSFSSLGAHLESIIGDKSAPDSMRMVAKAVAQVVKKLDIQVIAEKPGIIGEHVMGDYSAMQGMIRINENGREQASGTLLHEAAHAATIKGLAERPDLHNALYTLLQHVMKEDPRMAARYATSNTLEFLAEGLSNGEIQKRLQAIKASDEVHGLLGNIKNAWEGFTSIVRQALGMKPEDHNALTQFLDLAGATMKETASRDSFTASDPVRKIMAMRGSKITQEFDAILASLKARPDAAAAGVDGFVGAMEHLRSQEEPTYHLLRTAEEIETSLDRGLINKATPLDADLVEKWLDEMPMLDRIPSKDGFERAIDTANAKLSDMVGKDNEKGGDLSYSMQRTDPNAGRTPAQTKSIKDYIEQVLGKSVAQRLNAAIAHAGDYVESKLDENGKFIKGIIQVSVHALNPESVAYHESLHAFMQQLRGAGMKDMAVALEKAGGSSAVMRQLQAHFHDQPEVLAQIRNNPEERAAYMYQLHMAKQLRLGDGAKSVMENIADMVKKTLGIWTNDQRAQHIMDYFSSGEYAKKMGDKNAVAKALREPGRNAAVDGLVKLVKPLADFGEKVFATGHQRLRDTGVPALRSLADIIKPLTTGESKDPGFIPASRMARTDFLNKLGEQLGGYDNDQLNDALQSMQTQTLSQDVKVRTASRTIMNHLQSVFGYMKSAGVELGDRGPSYFPRVWDSDYISRHQTEFLDMLRKYQASGDMTGDPLAFMHSLIANEGNDFAVDTRRPGMQFAKERKMDFISHDDFAKFGEKDLYKTMSSYIGQATRRAEWTRRFGNDGQKLDALLSKAHDQGASLDDISSAETYLRGVNGTLGDTINPTLRRLQGNMIVYQNVRLLPLAIFSSMPDAAGIFVRGGTLGEAFDAFKRGFSEMPNAFKKDGGQRDWQTRMAEEIGTIDNASLGHALGSLYTQGMVGGGMQKLNDNFFRFNFMEGYNQSMRVAATQSAMNFIKRHATVDSTHSTRWLAELGLDKDYVNTHTKPDGTLDYMDPQMRMAINKWVDGAILRPDAADKPMWMNDPRFALLSHLKQFTYAFHKTILARVGHEATHGNYMPAAGLAAYVPIMIAADLAKGLIQGGGSQPAWKKNWGVADYLGDGIQRAGLLGVGQTGVDMYNSYERGGMGVSALAGPTLDQFGEAVKTLGGREQYGTMALHSLPANQLYTGYIKGASEEDAKFAE